MQVFICIVELRRLICKFVVIKYLYSKENHKGIFFISYLNAKNRYVFTLTSIDLSLIIITPSLQSS